MADSGKTGDWAKVKEILDTVPGPVLEKAIDQAVLQEAHFLRKKMIERFKLGGPGWAGHSSMTTAVRALLGNARGSKLLIQSADLRNSIGVVPSPGEVFVGVRRSATTKSALGVVNLAALHEGGKTWTVRMTDRQRRMLFAARRAAGIESDPGRAGTGDGMIHIRIPARPFVGPVLDEFAKPAALESSIVGRLAKILGGKLGTASGTPRA